MDGAAAASLAKVCFPVLDELLLSKMAVQQLFDEFELGTGDDEPTRDDDDQRGNPARTQSEEAGLMYHDQGTSSSEPSAESTMK